MNGETEDEILKYGEQCIGNMYGASSHMSLNSLRFQNFARKVTVGTSSVQVYVLPPTSDAASYHIRRTCLQTRSWIDNKALNPCEWGWEIIDGKLIPVKTKLPLAPINLLNVVRCMCKTKL